MESNGLRVSVDARIHAYLGRIEFTDVVSMERLSVYVLHAHDGKANVLFLLDI